MVKLGEIGTFIRGGGFLKRDYVDIGFPCIHYGQIHTKLGFVTNQHLTMIPETLVAKSKIASKNDVIIAITSEDVEGSCKSTAWMGDYDIAVGAHAAIFKHNQNPIYISYYLHSPFFNKSKTKYAHGFKVIEIKPSDIAKIEIPLPPLEEQHRIVSILDASFEKIDALKKNAEENLKNAKALFQQVLAQELKPKEGWVEKKLTDISENLDYKRVPITKNVRKSGKFPYYGASGIVDYVNDYLYDEDLLLISEDGANLLARTTPIAFSVSGKIWVNNHAHVLKFNNLTLQKFVEYFIAGFNIAPYVTGMAQPKLNQKALEKIIISFPANIEQQHRIVRTLDTLSEKCRRLEQVAQQTIRECDALKQSILRQAFSGEL